jgi:hypothetical protein
VEETELLGSQIAVHVQVVTPEHLPHHLHVCVAEVVSFKHLHEDVSYEIEAQEGKKHKPTSAAGMRGDCLGSM